MPVVDIYMICRCLVILRPSFSSPLSSHPTFIIFFCVPLLLMDGSDPPKTQQKLIPSSYICLHLLDSEILVVDCFLLLLFKDACGTRNGTFSIRVESVPCCDEALTCSRSVIFELQVNVSFCDTPIHKKNKQLTSCFIFFLLYFMYMCFATSFMISTKGHCHTDTERHEGD